MEFRKACADDVAAVTEIYDLIHTEEEQGRASIGWVRGVYPTAATAEAALERGDLFVAEDRGGTVATAIINQVQPDSYEQGNWDFAADPAEIMVLHTLVVDPRCQGRGYGRAFALFYEEYALAAGCRYLRIDTQEKNVNARALYRKLGYKEVDVVPCEFNGIQGVQLVLLEKRLDDASAAK